LTERYRPAAVWRDHCHMALVEDGFDPAGELSGTIETGTM
jgi:hypothetical protein